MSRERIQTNKYVPYKKRTKRSLNDHRMRGGTRPGNSVTCLEVDRSQLRSNGHQWIHTGDLQDAERMRTRQTARERGKPHTFA